MFWSLTNQAGLPIECATCWKWAKRQPLIEYVDQASSFLLSSPALYFTGGLLSGQVWFLNTSQAAVRSPPLLPYRKTASLSSQEGKSIEIWKQLLLSYPNNRWILCLYCFFKKKVNHGRPQFIIIIIITILYLQRHSKLNTNTFCERCLLEKPSGGILRNWNCEFTLSTATTGTGNVDRRTEIDRVGEWNEAWERE